MLFSALQFSQPMYVCMWMCTYNINACMHTPHIQYICTYVHTYICMYIHTCMHTYIHTSVYTYMHVCMHSFIYPFIHTCMRIYIHPDIQPSIYIRIHLHPSIHANPAFHTYISYIHTYMLYACVHACLNVLWKYIRGSNVYLFFNQIEAAQSRKFDFQEFCAAAISVPQLEGLEKWEEQTRKAYHIFEIDGNRVVLIEDLARVSSIFYLLMQKDIHHIHVFQKFHESLCPFSCTHFRSLAYHHQFQLMLFYMIGLDTMMGS